MKSPYKKELVFSPVEDNKIKNTKGVIGKPENLTNSPIWKNCKHASDRKPNESGFVYSIYFDGLTPISVISIDRV